MSNVVVLYPSIAAGQLTPMMAPAKVFLERGFAVTVALLDDPISLPTMSSTIERVVASQSHPSVSFHSSVPRAPPSPPASTTYSGTSPSYASATSSSATFSAPGLCAPLSSTRSPSMPVKCQRSSAYRPTSSSPQVPAFSPSTSAPPAPFVPCQDAS
ncbi:hypothetical protein GUJ93_ZPchr0005g15933 [Zizania palustris]|uniref:Uncharacterized protein n=1 Tax=Zizania palustris TaxID=103762 RepID=A0A8J5SW76_ZIZPA|nr:hypothetical protein GUJ93_ZPchr0005g15933 [Zizania palustris]